MPRDSWRLPCHSTVAAGLACIDIRIGAGLIEGHAHSPCTCQVPKLLSL